MRQRSQQQLAAAAVPLAGEAGEPDELVNHLRALLRSLSWHLHVADHQAAEWHAAKDGLQPGELLLSMDFSENTSLVVGREIQNNYWQRAQSTLLPVITWHWPEGAPAPIKTTHIVVSPDGSHSHM